MLILLAGLPGVGKTTLAKQLIQYIPCYWFNRDLIRDGLFPPDMLDYSNEQNALAACVMREVVRYIFKKDPRRTILIDGRPFSKAKQIVEYQLIAEQAGCSLCIIHCVAPDEVIQKRLLNDANAHKMKRTWEKNKKIMQTFEPIPFPHLTLDTSKPLEEQVSVCLRYIETVKSGEVLKF